MLPGSTKSPHRLPDCLSHYYEAAIGPFVNLSDLSLGEAEAKLESIRRAKQTFASQRSSDYLAIRRQLEDRVRDLFIVGCWTGLRFSDWNQIRPENISDGFLELKQQKTGGAVVIPLHPTVQAILDKYDGNLPPVLTNQKFNEFLKIVAKKAEIRPIRKALHKWAPRIVRQVGRDMSDLPEGIQNLLVFCSSSRWANALRELLNYWEKARSDHTSMGKVADLLHLKKRTLENILNFQTTASDETLDRIEAHLSDLRKYLGMTPGSLGTAE